MGISLLSTLLELHGFPAIALVFYTLACCVAITLIGGWIVFRSPTFASQAMPAWAMVSMGLVSLGSASMTIFGDPMWPFMLTLWIIGTLLGLTTYAIYLPKLIRGNAGSPTFAWGLPLVTPMVASTSASHLSSHYGLEALRCIAIALFLLTIAVAPVVFARVYLYFFSPGGARLPSMASPTSWIPIGMVGQSTAAALLIGLHFDAHPLPAIIYGIVMCIIAVPLGALAHVVFYKAVASGTTYSPTWWASTFPVGTLSLGTHYLSTTTNVAWLDYVSLYLLALMLFHVVVSTIAGTIAIARKIP